jgi:hypothetical protein
MSQKKSNEFRQEMTEKGGFTSKFSYICQKPCLSQKFS